ncbi:MAG: RNA polymerase sigma factor [Opitutaceae bacterium]
MPTPQTNYTLIHRAHNLGDEAAWNQLIQHYRRFIVYILRKLNMPENDLEDVTQQVLIRLSRELPKFDKERAKFRTWLSRMITNIAISHFRRPKRQHTDIDYLDIKEGGGHIAEIESIIENEWSTYIETQAIERVREVFKGKAILVFELGLRGCSTEEIALQTQLSVSSVYTLRKRVKKRLYTEIRSLIDDLEK